MVRLDAHTETLHPWDVAAGGLIATQAGAMRTLGVTAGTGYVPTTIAGAQRYEVVPWTGGDQAVWG